MNFLKRWWKVFRTKPFYCRQCDKHVSSLAVHRLKSHWRDRYGLTILGFVAFSVLARAAPTITITREPELSIGPTPIYSENGESLMQTYFRIDGMPEQARRTAWLMYVQYGDGIITWGCAEPRTEEWSASCCCQTCIGLDVRGRDEGPGLQYLGFVATREPGAEAICTKPDGTVPGCGFSCSGGGNGATFMRQVIRPDYYYWIGQPDGVYEREVKIQDGHAPDSRFQNIWSCCWDEICGDTTYMEFEPRRALGLTPGPPLKVYVRKRQTEQGTEVVLVEGHPVQQLGPYTGVRP